MLTTAVIDMDVSAGALLGSYGRFERPAIHWTPPQTKSEYTVASDTIVLPWNVGPSRSLSEDEERFVRAALYATSELVYAF